MNISEKSIKDNIAYVVADFRRTTAKSSSTDDISRVHFIALGQLLGMRLCFPSFFDLIQIAIDELEAIESEAFSRIIESGDVGRSSAQSSAALGQGGNQTVTVTNRRQS